MWQRVSSHPAVEGMDDLGKKLKKLWKPKPSKNAFKGKANVLGTAEKV